MRQARFRFVSLAPVLVCLVFPGSRARGEGPADRLLALVPADSAAVLVVEDLARHADRIARSPLARAFLELPMVQEWRGSAQHAKWRRARGEIERFLGIESLESAVRKCLGRAAVLALRHEAGKPSDQAAGLLIAEVADRGLLERALGRLDQAEKDAGTLRETRSEEHRGARYGVRSFQPGTKPDEAFVFLDDRTFAWSNSEAIIRLVIERFGDEDQAGGLGGTARFRAVRSALPAGAVVSAFIDPRYLERQESGGNARRAAGDRMEELVRRNLNAVEYAGAALVWDKGPVLHLHETIDASKLDAPLRSWADRPTAAPSLLGRVPESALLVVVGQTDFRALAGLLALLVPESDHRTSEAFWAVVDGALLGLDARREVLPALGPEVLGFVDVRPDAPLGWARFPLVGAVAVRGETRPQAALFNAARMLLALGALDSKPNDAKLWLEDAVVAGTRVLALRGGPVPLAVAVGGECLVLGTSVEAVATFAGRADTDATREAPWRAAIDEHIRSFLYIDLKRLVTLAREHRDALAEKLSEKRPRDEALRDLDHVVALLGLFKSGYATNAIAPGFTAMHQTIGLIGQDGPTP